MCYYMEKDEDNFSNSLSLSEPGYTTFFFYRIVTFNLLFSLLVAASTPQLFAFEWCMCESLLNREIFLFKYHVLSGLSQRNVSSCPSVVRISLHYTCRTFQGTTVSACNPYRVNASQRRLSALKCSYPSTSPTFQIQVVLSLNPWLSKMASF